MCCRLGDRNFVIQSSFEFMESEEYRDNRSVSKIETIKLLNNTIERLEAIVREIESQPNKDLPDLASVETLAKNIENLGIALREPQSLQSVSQSATPSKSEPSSVKPQSVKKSSRNNRRTIAILTGTVVLVVVGLWLWLSPPTLEFLTRQTPPEVEAQLEDTRETVATKPPKTSENPVVPPAELPPKLEEEVSETTIPPELSAPTEEENIPVKTVESPLPLTPEQSLIAAVRERVTAITQEYPEDAVLSVSADFAASKLLVTVGNSWYELSDARQSQLADEILRRSRKLDFQKLELKDADDNLLARSPVVGDRAIIYSKRQRVNNE